MKEGEFDTEVALKHLREAYVILEERRKKNSPLANFKKGLSSLHEKRGLSRLFGYGMKAKQLAEEMIRDMVVKNRGNREEAKEAAEYAIASGFLEIYYDRYSRKFIKELIKGFKTPQYQAFFRDHTIVELQKIQLNPDDKALKYKHRASGIMSIPALIEKLEAYSMTVAMFEAENGGPQKEPGEQNASEIDD